MQVLKNTYMTYQRLLSIKPLQLPPQVQPFNVVTNQLVEPMV